MNATQWERYLALRQSEFEDGAECAALATEIRGEGSDGSIPNIAYDRMLQELDELRIISGFEQAQGV